jgi:hypothetical protein
MAEDVHDNGRQCSEANSAMMEVPAGTAQQQAEPGSPCPLPNEDRPQLVVVHGKKQRKDRGRIHAVRHGVLARHPLEALRHLGEDLKRLRRLERQFREELQPQGALADLIFDRFWSSYLRCLLAARVEASAFLASVPNTTNPATNSKLVDADRPTLVPTEEASNLYQVLPPDVLRQLALVQRYDARYSGEMYRALGLLIVMRAKGDAGLEECISANLGIGKGGSPLP